MSEVDGFSARSLRKAVQSDWASIVIGLVTKSGSASAYEVAKLLSITEDTARSRLKKLVAAGALTKREVNSSTGRSLTFCLPPRGELTNSALAQEDKAGELARSALILLPLVARQYASAVSSSAPDSSVPRLNRRVVRLSEEALSRVIQLIDKLELELEASDGSGDANLAVTIVLT